MKQAASAMQNEGHLEQGYWDQGVGLVAGVDEVGRGALAGPVVAAAVVFSPTHTFGNRTLDSKKYTPTQREKIYAEILSTCLSFGIGIVPASEIDELNILQASLKAMRLAVEALAIKPEVCLVDGNQKFPHPCVQRTVIEGDAKVQSIGAASIVAKVSRDKLMEDLSEAYEVYGFKKHKGYGTRFHYEALQKFGPSDIHRKSFNLHLTSSS